MPNLNDNVLQHLDPASINAIASRLGIDPAKAQAAVQQALPVLIGGLAHNAATPQGAGALHNALQDHAGADIGGVLGSVLGGNSGIGGAILGHILGGQQGAAAQNIGQASGIGTQNAGQLLAMLAPILMGVLGNMSQKQNMNAGGLGGMLGREAQSLGQAGFGGLLGSIFSQGGPGGLASLGGLLKAGESLLGGGKENA